MATILLSTQAMAADNPIALSAEVSTLGYGANASWAINDAIEVVAGWSGANGNYKLDTSKFTNELSPITEALDLDDVLGFDFKGDMTVDAKLNNPYVGIQVRPFAGSLMVNTGVILQDNKLDINLANKAGEQIKLNKDGASLSFDGQLNLKLESARKTAPYLTLGFKPDADSRFGLFGEVGAVYAGESNIQIGADIKNATATINGVPLPQNEVDARVQSIKNDLLQKTTAKVPLYPIIKVGATIRF